jgi:two-component system, sensor histidine kinase and response regulator
MSFSMLWKRYIDRLLIFSVVLTLLSILIGSLLVGTFIRHNYEEKVRDGLQTVLNATNKAFLVSTEDHILQAEAIAGTPELLDLSEQLLQEEVDREALLNNPAQKMLRSSFELRLKNSLYQGFFIIGPDNMNLASSRDANVGITNLLTQQPDVLQTLWSGHSAVSRVQKSDVELDKNHSDATMFAAAPIRNQAGNVIALLTLRIDPHRVLFPILMQGRLGQSGETYLFDQSSQMLSPSHFEDQLSEMKLLAPGEHSELNMYVYDPGRNLQLEPLAVGEELTIPTRMAASAQSQESGYDLQGYRGYRGVLVIGAWMWDETLNVGIATEQDYDEAYSLLHQILWLTYGAAVLVALLIILMSFLFFKGRQQIAETENRLRAIFDTTSDCILVINTQGLIESVNPATTKTFGYSSDQLLGKNISMLMPEPYQSMHDGYLKRFIDSGEASVIGTTRELTALHADGREFDIEISVSQFQLKSELHFGGMIRDITDRVLSEQLIKQERDKVASINSLLTLTENALDRTGIGEYWIRAADGRVVRANDTACERLGYTRQQLLKMHVSDFAPDFPVDQWKSLVAPIREAGWGRFDAIHQTCDGVIIPVEISSTFQAKGSGFDEDIFITFVFDISQRVETESALKNLNDQLRMMALVAEKTDNAVVLTGLDGRIKWVNAGFTRVTGYSFDEVLDRKPGDFLQGPDTDPDTVASITEAINRNQRIDTEILNYHKNGTAYWIQIEITPVADENGEVVEFIALERDITQEKKAAEDLIRAKQEAETANRAKSSFLALMSHEIRTPLNGIVSTIELLTQGKLDEYQQDMLGTARDSSLTLMRIIDDILDFSKIEAGRMDLEYSTVDLEALLESVSESLRENARQRDVELLIYVDPQMPFVEGDPVRLKQILYNLSGNAIKFCGNLNNRKGQVRIGLYLGQDTDETVEIQIRVEDNGIGMSKKVQQRVFNPFVQGEGDTTRRYGGTGLGLVITRRLTEMMNGKIQVDSEENQGTSFTVTLNLKKAEQQLPGYDPSVLSGVHIISVIDNEFLANAVHQYLHHAGATIIRSSQENVISSFDELLHLPGSEVIVLIDFFQTENVSKQLKQSLIERKAGKTLRFIHIDRGRRRNVRVLNDDTLMLDVDAVQRHNLVNAVAVASGRESPSLIQAKETKVLIPEVIQTPSQARNSGQVILLADDNKTNQKVISQQISILGYAVDIAEDGEHALQLWRQNDYLILLTDCHMPNMDGYELARTIRNSETESQHLPIIAITADAMKGTSEKCFAAGMDDYLTKPMQLKDLQEAITRWISAIDSRHQTHHHQALSDPEDDVVNPDALSTLLGSDDPEMLAGFYQDFISTSEEIYQILQKAFTDGDVKTLAEQAHKLKSSANTIGALKLGEICQEMEKAGKTGDKKTILHLMPGFNDIFSRVKVWVENFLQTNIGG